MTKPPSREKFTKEENNLIQSLRTPLQVQRYLTSLQYNMEVGGGTMRSFREVVRRKEAHCLEGALAAAVVLEQHGYPPLLLDLESVDLLDHVIFVFKQNGLWGSIARSRDISLHGRRPVFRLLRELVWSYYEPYVDFSGRIKGYGLTNLHELGNYDWRFSDRRMLRVEDHLRNILHKPLHSSDTRYDRLRERYKKFKERYPNGAPTYYKNRWQWMR